ncbi:phospholipase D-like domain-containing protein [Luteolibacter marinus]|uniref:phospholipase D-like domain-containing protein n=1 Tax=Luteolibacter marinus TaxID=2776705 RepID=UPI00186903D6
MNWNPVHLVLNIGPLDALDVVLLLVISVLVFMIWRLVGHKECHYTDSPGHRIDGSLDALAGSTHGHPTEGNSIRLVSNAEYFEEVERAISSARKSVHFETFLWEDGETGSMVSEALMAAARRGLKVRVMGDASGTRKLCARSTANLRDAGCEVHRFHRIWKPMNFGRINIRDHRKILVIDGKLAIVGGHCITDQWLKDGPKLPRYRDISAVITGPVVAHIQSCFFEGWTEITGELFTDDATFPKLRPTGDSPAHVAFLKPDGCPSSVQVLHHLAIGYAKERIRIQNPYFLPDPSGVESLVNAAQRGVDVQIMIPALTATDSPLIARAGRYQFKRLLEGGVRLFEYQPTLLHQKILVVDGVWFGIGSSNFDDRSFEINKEITVGVADPAVAGQLEQIFEEDLAECREVTAADMQRRSVKDRLLDRFMYLFNEQF